MGTSHRLGDLVATILGASLLVVGSGGAAAAPNAPARAPLGGPAAVRTVGPTIGGSQQLHVSIPELLVGPATALDRVTAEIPVLLTAPGAAGTARVPAAGTDCSQRVVAGSVVRLRCALAAGHPGASVVVELEDGRTLTRRI